MKLSIVTVLSFCTVFIISCSTNKKVATTAPVQTKSLPPLPVSQINIPVKIYLRPALARMDSMMSKEFTSEKWPDYYQPSCDFRYKYRFIRSPFTFQVVNNRVTIGFQGNYQIAGSRSVCAFDKQVSPWVSGSCGFGNEPLRKVDITINSLLELLPRYQVRTTTRLDKLTPRDKCVVSLLQTDMTREIMDSIRVSVESYTSTFDRFIMELNQNQVLQRWRSNGNRVVPVKKYGFLNLNPTQLRMGAFNYYRDTLVFSLGFNGRPEFSSDSGSIVNTPYLPPFTNSESNNGISTYLNVEYDFSYLSSLLNDSLRNKPFEVEGRTFVIKNVHLAGTENNRIRLDVSFDGFKRGTLHLEGTPQLDTSKQVLSMPDVNASLDSKDMLMNIARGLIQKKIIKQLQNMSVLDLAALVEKHKPAIQARLNQPLNEWMTTSGTFDQLKLTGLVVDKKSIKIQIYVKGTLSIIATPPVSSFSF